MLLRVGIVATAVLTLLVAAHGGHDDDHDADGGNATHTSALSSCGVVLGQSDAYDQSLHIAAIFVVWGASLVGGILPIGMSRLACNGRAAMHLVGAFGFGVVVATAFVHMIPAATETLQHPCLDLTYSGLAMAIVVATVLAMQVVEIELTLLMTTKRRLDHVTDLPKFTESTTMSRKSDVGELRQSSFVLLSAHGAHHAEPPQPHAHPHHHHPAANDDNLKSTHAMRKTINVLIFEVGVAIHSFIIGLNLGVATGSSFNTLWIAITFHQFFEGVAVGSSALSAFTTLRSSIYTALAYSLTTPLGMALGVAINSSYSDTSTMSLWVRGIMDAITGGILVYTGLVELLTYQYTINADFHDKSLSMRACTYACLCLGASAMALIGYWA
ncbi:Aste57867_8950 [Aphanomyces stellatus]|uniref:Aste57867_8950 protein n=1 Tax=Aphanomyces stellatus TaxID=120398 RepID=A0A485KLN6_9STRA|nr:hypothetical protein As57867_008915 [Aphanomyces stellatus]VFT85834.1 Aste57867_8950 [Aphanomyces stellatus]